MNNFRFYSFHSIKGISIIPSDDYCEMLFGDFTLLSVDEIYKFIECEKFSNISSDEERKTNTKHDLNIMEHQEGVKSDCFLVVGSYENDRNHQQKRAYEIISCLSNIFLLISNFRETCCLIDEFFSIKNRHIVTIDIDKYSDTQTSGFPIKSDLIFTLYPPKQISRHELLILLTNDNFKYYKNFLFRESSIKKNLKDILLNSSIQIYNATNFTLPEMQLVVYITALEILLRESENDNYDKIQNRLRFLIGDVAFKFFNEEFLIEKKQDKEIRKNLFKLRHDIVHNGAQVNKSLASGALRLSLLTLLQYAKVSLLFNNKNEFITYLDTKIVTQNYYKKKSFSNLLSRWNKINFKSELLDYLPCYLYKYFQSSKNINKEISFLKAVKTYSSIRNIDNKNSFESFNNLLIDSDKIFNNYDDFSLFIQNNPIEVDSNIEGIKDFSWYFDKFLME
ncbi:MAG: hypothetical protein HZB41_02365 [Ignavibacteriae bacterium]|nr:hypothetical protein [Ignavibacteriota bacterium]